MFDFDPTKVTTEIVYLKSVTTVLGGSIQIVDQTLSVGSKEVLKRITVPMAVARDFIKQTRKITKYLKPTLTCLVRYGDDIISMERHPLSSLGELYEQTAGGMQKWKPFSEMLWETYVLPLTTNGVQKWYFDGRYVYSFDEDIKSIVGNSTFVSSGGQYREVVTQAIDMQFLADRNKILPKERRCLAFVLSNGNFTVSPPIWKNLAEVGSRKMVSTKDEDDFEDDDDSATRVYVGEFQFDRIDNELSVNLNFALKAGDIIGKVFGYEYVEPLQLARLMIELNTVNLPNVPKEVKSTYDINMKFTHIIAWLLGLQEQTKTLKDYVRMRSLIKYLTTKGIYNKESFVPNSVFRADQNIEDVPLIALNDLMTTKKISTIASLVDKLRKEMAGIP